MSGPYTISAVDRIINGILNCHNLRELDEIFHSLPVQDISLNTLPRGLRFKVRCILSLGMLTDAIKQQGNMDYLRGLIADQLSQFNEPDEMQCSRAICNVMDNINSFRDENSILLEFRRIGEMMRN